MKPTMIPTTALATILTLLLVIMPTRAETEGPGSKRQQYYAQTSEQLAFCSGLTRAHRQQLDKGELSRRKHAELMALAAEEIAVFAYAANVVADRRSIPAYMEKWRRFARFDASGFR